MRLKAVLFDIMVPFFTFILGVLVPIVALLWAMVTSKDHELERRNRRVSYASYYDR